jgi:hypothetical protein
MNAAKGAMFAKELACSSASMYPLRRARQPTYLDQYPPLLMLSGSPAILPPCLEGFPGKRSNRVLLLNSSAMYSTGADTLPSEVNHCGPT